MLIKYYLNYQKLSIVQNIFKFSFPKGTTAEIVRQGRLKVPSTLGFIYFVYAASSPLKQKIPTIKKMEQPENTNLDDVIKNADQLFDENHYQETSDTLKAYQDQSLPEIKWREARALYSISKTVDKSEKQKYLGDALALAKSALESDANNFAIHKWLAIIMDAHAEGEGIKARVSQLEVVQTHMKKAVELNPQDSTSWYVLGSFEFNLADLPWIQRKVVSAIFATPPTGTYEKALEYFQKAEELKPGFYTTNWLMLGKCFIALKQNDKAKEFIEKAANCKVLNVDDKTCKEEATQLLKKF